MPAHYVEERVKMKLLITGDWHLRGSSPENRIDNFFETQLDKVEQILQLASKNRCQAILCPGDVFDNPRPSFDVLEYYIKLFKKYSIGNSNSDEIEFLTVWGQHDQRFRTKERTALRLMESLGYMQTFKKITYGKYIDIYGCDYGEEIPIIENEDNFNILLIHKTVANKPLWNGHNDFLQSDKLFKNNPYDIIINGDYHLSTSYEYKNQIIYNCGCIVRKTIAEASHTPHVLLITINDEDLTYTLKKVELIYKASDEVFKPEALSREVNVENAKMITFIESIKSNSISKNLDFKKNLENLLISIEQPIKDIIMEELNNI